MIHSAIIIVYFWPVWHSVLQTPSAVWLLLPPTLHYSDWRTLWQPFTAAELDSGLNVLKKQWKKNIEHFQKEIQTKVVILMTGGSNLIMNFVIFYHVLLEALHRSSVNQTACLLCWHFSLDVFGFHSWHSFFFFLYLFSLEGLHGCNNLFQFIILVLGVKHFCVLQCLRCSYLLYLMAKKVVRCTEMCVYCSLPLK